MPGVLLSLNIEKEYRMKNEGNFMNGMELSLQYYEEYGRALIEEKFSDISGYITVGLAGSGSECYGFDDEESKDHDFEPGFCIFIPDEDVIDEKTAFALQREYDKLPASFCGFSRQKMKPVGGNRHGVIRISDFYFARCGKKDGELTVYDWLTVPEYALAEAVNGKIFKDGDNNFLPIRKKLQKYPDDIRLKKLAGYLLTLVQAGQYNYGRCVKRGETAAAQMAVFKFVEAALHVIYLLNGKYMPYYKWSFKGIRELSRLGNLYDSLEYLISSDNDEKRALVKAGMIEDVAALVVKELKEEGITDATCFDLEKHAYSVNDHIGDGMLRNLDIFAGV